MATKLDVFNASLLLVGQADTIPSVNDNGPQGKALRTFYKTEYETLLTTMPWSFAYRSVPLTPWYDMAEAQLRPNEYGASFTSPVLEWAVDTLYGVGEVSGIRRLVTIDPDTGAAQLRSNASISEVIDLAWNGTDLYALMDSGLVTLNRQTAAASAAQSIQVDDPVGIAWDGLQMWAIDQKNLYALDHRTGRATPVGPHRIPERVQGLVFNGVRLHTLGSSSKSAYLLNRRTGVGTFAFNAGSAGSLAWVNREVETEDDPAFYQAGETQLRRLKLDRDNAAFINRYVAPDYMLRLWTWEDENQDFPGVAVEGEAIRSNVITGAFSLPHVSLVDLSIADELFVQLLEVRIARKIAPAMAERPGTLRNLDFENRALTAQAFDVQRSQRKPRRETNVDDPRPDINEVGRHALSGPYGYLDRYAPRYFGDS